MPNFGDLPVPDERWQQFYDNENEETSDFGPPVVHRAWGNIKYVDPSRGMPRTRRTYEFLGK